MKNEKNRKWITVALFVGFTAMFFAGLYLTQGESLSIVLNKAIKICLQCIGIG